VEVNPVIDTQHTRPGVATVTGSLTQLAHTLVAIALRLNGIFLYVFFLSPLLIVILFSFNSASRITPPIDGFTLNWYGEALGNSLLLEAVRNSVLVALCAGAIATVLSTLAGYVLYQYPFRFSRVVEIGAYLPLITPGLIYGVALLIYFYALGVKPSLVTIIAAHVTMTLPFAFIIISNVGLVNLDRSLEEASMDLGASRLTTFWRVTLPIVQPAVMAAFMFSAIISFNELILAFFLGGTENTLPIFVWSQFQRRITPEINAISSIMVGVTVLTILCIGLVLRLSSGYGQTDRTR